MNNSNSGCAELAPQMKVVHFGKLLKKSSVASSAAYCERWCVLTYGIWCYFTSRTKAKRFLDTLPWSNSINNLTTKDQHRKAFKVCLKNNPPRGYIKMLNRDGTPVSSVSVSRVSWAIEISHNGRTFHLRGPSDAEFKQWLSVFQCLQMSVKINDPSPPHHPPVHVLSTVNVNDSLTNGLTQWTLNGISCSPSPVKLPAKWQREDPPLQSDVELTDNKPTAASSESAVVSMGINYDEEDARLLNESKRLEQLLNQDRDKILSSFAEIRKSIKTEQ